MSEKKNIFQIFGKLVEETLINPAMQLLEPKSRVGAKEKADSVIPPTLIAVFWDYENFPLPKKITPEIFFETLFPSGLNYQFVAKRIYGNQSIFSPLLLKKLEKHGFEYIRGLPTGKPSSTDFMLVSDCASQCSKFKTPIVAIIISGDADLIPLVQNLSSQGHDIRLICQEKGKISPELHRIVPVIMDRQDIINGCQRLRTTKNKF